MKKSIAAIMAAVLVLSQTVPVLAAGLQAEGSKEEVVYINLKGDGAVDGIYVVNIFEPEPGRRITDYGEYETVRNMTTLDEIAYNGETAAIDTQADKLYYEGKLKSDVVPWKIAVHYFIDGREYPAETVAGMTGQLKIAISISENEEYRGTFFDDYALQASLTMDTEKFRSISAPQATVANVGNAKQLTYTVLAGKGAEIEITAAVTDFETDGFSINAIPLNLNIEVDDDELMKRITELLEAIAQLDNGAEDIEEGSKELYDAAQGGLQSGAADLDLGAGELQNGALALEDGGRSLEAGADSLSSGAGALDQGIKSLNTGIVQVQKGLDELNQQSDGLTAGSTQIKAALIQLQEALKGVTSSAEELETLVTSSASIKQAIDQLASGAAELQSSVSFAAYKTVMAQNGLDISALQAGNSEALDSVSRLLEQIDNIEVLLGMAGVPAELLEPLKVECAALSEQLTILLNGNNAAILGMEAYLNNVEQGAAELAAGAASLNESYTEFDTAIGELVETLTAMLFQMSELKGAVDTLVTEYGKLDEGLHEYTEGVAQVAAGYQQITDGVSDLAEGSSEVTSGSKSLYGGTTEMLQGIVALYQASGTLKDGTGQLNASVAELLTGLVTLNNGTETLKDGTGELHTATAGMDSEIEAEISTLLDSVSGGDRETVSFVSKKNKRVDSVQFVIQTAAIRIVEPPGEEIKEEKPLGFGEKLLKLFTGR